MHNVILFVLVNPPLSACERRSCRSRLSDWLHTGSIQFDKSGRKRQWRRYANGKTLELNASISIGKSIRRSFKWLSSVSSSSRQHQDDSPTCAPSITSMVGPGKPSLTTMWSRVNPSTALTSLALTNVPMRESSSFLRNEFSIIWTHNSVV